jgi:BASS family bile acid:Na+ symporter
MQAVAALAFSWRGVHQALTTGLCSGNRNLGLLLGAMADRASQDLLIIIAVAQFPIYILPMVQRRLYRRWLGPDASSGPDTGNENKKERDHALRH